jgi:hypothetical protein
MTFLIVKILFVRVVATHSSARMFRQGEDLVTDFRIGEVVKVELDPFGFQLLGKAVHDSGIDSIPERGLDEDGDRQEARGDELLDDATECIMGSRGRTTHARSSGA